MYGQTLKDADPSTEDSTEVVETTPLSWVLVSRAFNRMCFWLSVLSNMALIVGLVCAFRGSRHWRHSKIPLQSFTNKKDCGRNIEMLLL